MSVRRARPTESSARDSRENRLRQREERRARHRPSPGRQRLLGRLPAARRTPPARCSVTTVLTCTHTQRRGNLGAGWAANVFCPPKEFSQHISSRPNYTPVIPALVDSISDSRSLRALCSISQLVTSVNYLKNFPLIETKARTSFNQRKVSPVFPD